MSATRVAVRAATSGSARNLSAQAGANTAMTALSELVFANFSAVAWLMKPNQRRLTGDTARAATTDEVKQLRREAQDLKEVVAEQALELRLLKKSMIADGADQT